ncbi:MAG: biotin--[acetyl-CoA-carboxylase] ligase, partial [Planctomycetia bacterium]|nr:biotin--[acetyl-CoA-carboxylase] ligase [Planctomycetia bacterium]
MSLPFARTVVDRDEVSSTSDLARELVVSGGVELPLLVRAGRQTRGRGRGSNTWWSDRGSLTFTLAIDPLAHGLTT